MHTNYERLTVAACSQRKLSEADTTATGFRRVSSPQVIQPYIPRKRQERSGLLVDFLFSPATNKGYDYLDFLLLGENRYGVMLADFSDLPTGWDAEAALPLLKLTLSSKSAGLSAAATLRYLDQHVAELSTNGFLITALYLIFDQSKRLLSYASAGHLPMLLHRPTDNKTFLLTASGAPFAHEINDPGTDQGVNGLNKIMGESIALRQGDFIVLYGSGLLKQRNRSGDYFGRQRLVELLNKFDEPNPMPFLAELQRQLDAFVDGQPQEHDVAVVALKNTLRDLERPPAEALDHEISGRFLCIEDEQIIIDTLRDHPNANMKQIAGELAAHDLRHLGKDRVQAYLSQTSHWLVSKPAPNGLAGKNGAQDDHAGNGFAASSTLSIRKTLNTVKQLQQDLLAAFPIREVLGRSDELLSQLPEAARAMEFYNVGDYERAFFEFSRLRDDIKNSAKVHCLFGNLYLLLNKSAEAKQEYLMALELEQRLSDAHLALSYVALLEEDFYAAIDELSTALRLDKNLQAHNTFLQQLVTVVEKRENRSEWLV